MENIRYYNGFVPRHGEDRDDIKTVINYMLIKNPAFFNEEILEDAILTIWNFSSSLKFSNIKYDMSVYYTNGLIEVLLGGYFETFIQYLKDIYEDKNIAINRGSLYEAINSAQIIFNIFRFNNPLYPPYKSKICQGI